jgi:hypothetical protein
VWAAYLTSAAFLAVTRVTLFLWLVHRSISHTSTEMDSFLLQLYPEPFVGVFWNSLAALDGTTYYVVWISLFTFGSFLFTTPVLFVGWLRHRNLVVQIATCGLTIAAASLLLLAIVRLFGVGS